MSSIEKRTLEKCRDILVRRIQISPGFLKYFIQFDILDKATTEKILNIQTGSQQTEYFLQNVIAKREHSLPVLIHKLKIDRKTINLASTLEHAYEMTKSEQKMKVHEKDKRTLIKLFDELNNFYLLLFGTKSWKSNSQTLEFHLTKCKQAVSSLRRIKESLEEKYGVTHSLQTLEKKILEDKAEHEMCNRQLLITEQEVVDLRTDFRRHNHQLYDKVRKREEEIANYRKENQKIKSQLKILAKYTYKSELLCDLDLE